jgi:hypothetical protein
MRSAGSFQTPTAALRWTFRHYRAGEPLFDDLGRSPTVATISPPQMVLAAPDL